MGLASSMKSIEYPTPGWATRLGCTQVQLGWWCLVTKKTPINMPTPQRNTVTLSSSRTLGSWRVTLKRQWEMETGDPTRYLHRIYPPEVGHSAEPSVNPRRPLVQAGEDIWGGPRKPSFLQPPNYCRSPKLSALIHLLAAPSQVAPFLCESFPTHCPRKVLSNQKHGSRERASSRKVKKLC